MDRLDALGTRLENVAADLPAMVQLLEEDRADFVVGSRQLGRTENTDSFRNLGVRFFAALISKLTVTRASTKLAATATTTATRSWNAHQAASAAIAGRIRVAAVPPRPQPTQ